LDVPLIKQGVDVRVLVIRKERMSSKPGERNVEMKKGVILSCILLVLFSSGLSLSCKSVTPVSPTSGSSPAIPPAPATPVSAEPSSAIKPTHPPVIWWGPKPETPEMFLTDMKKYYPEWHKWFTNHPEDIVNYFPPPPPDCGTCGGPVSVKTPERTKATTVLIFSGVVKKLDGAARTIEVSGKRMNMTLVLNDETKITRAESGLVLSDIEEGMNVFIEYKAEDDKMIATAVKVVEPGAKTKKKRTRPPKELLKP
jgi:hypothetical protein